MPHDMDVRREMYQVLESNEMHSKKFIMAGDWNAAYMAADRSTGELQQPADDEHAQMLQRMQMRPTDDSSGEDSRQHTWYAEGQKQQHSRVDDFTWSKSLQTGRKATTTVLKAVTGDSDHYPLLAEIPLDNISFAPPGPELPQPDREARIKWPATAKQLQDYKMQTEMRVGQAAKTEAAAMKAAIRRADEIIGNRSHEEKLRLNKRDELKTAGITQEVVLAHASKTSEMSKDANRGTIQGDSLSPFLFWIFMEPLLRWLQSGGRGYQYGCLKTSTSADHSTSAMAYADDLLAISSEINHLVEQTQKKHSQNRLE